MKKGYLSGVPSKGKRVLALFVGLLLGYLIGYYLCISGYMDFSEKAGRIIIFSNSIPLIGFILSILMGIGFAFLGYRFPKPFLVIVVIFAGIFKVLAAIGSKTSSSSSSSSSTSSSFQKQEKEEIYIVNAYVVNTSSSTRYAYARLSDGSTKNICSGNNDLRIVNWTTKTVNIADRETDCPTNPIMSKYWSLDDQTLRSVR